MDIQKTHFTTGELSNRFAAPVWLIRRIVDSLGKPIPRVGYYRYIPADLMPEIEAKLRIAGYLPIVKGAAANA